MRTIIYLVMLVAAFQGVSAERIYLSGMGPSDAVNWEFFCSGGRNSGEWSTIPVPSNWEQHGFGDYDYGHVAPHDKHKETGRYRVRFHAPEAWQDKVVRLVFEGVMTDTSIKLNGNPVGSMNQGGYNQFHYLLTDTGAYGEHAVKFGEDNELEVLVAKTSANVSLEAAERKADYWVFGGIYRPVYLEVLPKAFINRLAIDADADGQFRMDIFPQVHLPRDNGGGDHVDQVVARIETLDGAAVGSPMIENLSGGGASRVRLESRVAAPLRWSPEHPNLYQVRVSLKLRGKNLHEKVERFGFRTLDVRPKDGLYLNDKKILIRGVNRNGFHPESARALDPEAVREDARAIKSMNANAVRCHLPPTEAFLDACDELGLLFVIERTNWQRPVADTSVSRHIVHDLVTRLHNHPSLIMWANGNESGFNHEIDELFSLLDLQERPVIHPWTLFDGINTHHYLDFGGMKNRLEQKDDILLPTELLHGLYDGGHGAGLDDYWNLMRSSPLSAGCFLWCWTDAAVVRTDRNGQLDTDGNHSADGIVGPYGEKEASYFTVREIWSPIQIPMKTLSSDFRGVLPVENRFDETTLDQCTFQWRLLKFSEPDDEEVETTVHSEGRTMPPGIEPGDAGACHLNLPDDWTGCDALELAAVGPYGTPLMHWSWPIQAESTTVADLEVKPRQRPGKPFEVQVGKVLWSFSPETGRLLKCGKAGAKFGPGQGPVLYAGAKDGPLSFSNDWKTKAIQNGNDILIESVSDDGSRFRWTFSQDGKVQLDYSFSLPDHELNYCAVGFDLPEEQVQSKRWRGNGPFRIWGNRSKGGRYGLWDNDYNDGITGVNWIYPEFKGVFGNVDWMQVSLKDGTRILMDTEPGTDVGILRPSNGSDSKEASPKRATWSYPEQGGLFLFHKVPSVGTKFKDAPGLGPQSRPQRMEGPIEGTLILGVQ